MSVATILLVAALAVVVLVVLGRANEIFCVSVKNGRLLVVRGAIPTSLLHGLADVVQRDRVEDATIRAVRADGHARLGIEMAASHYHVAKWAQSGGYVFSSSVQARTFTAINDALAAIRAAGHPLTRTQQSWACVAQSLPAEQIPVALNMHGPIWMQDNLGQQCLWVHKPLTDKARQLLSVTS